MSHNHEKIDYVELPATNIPATKAFFEAVFAWHFTDYGPDYTAFNRQGIEGGFFHSDMHADSDRGGALLIFYSHSLEQTLAKVTNHGGKIKKPIFHFPGGRRFHFTCPSNNEFAVWSDK